MLLLVTLTLQLATASTTPEAATLHVGIHRDAGTIYEIAADGAAGQCTTGPARLSCPARGAVRFRWAGDPAWQLTGQDEVGPGEVARAWVLAREELRQQDRRRLEPERVSAAAVRDLFGRDGAHQPPAPSRAMLDDLAALCLHEDLEVRKAAADGLMPWLRRTWADPLSP